MAGHGKATFVEKADRLQQIYQLVIIGLPRQAILAYCEEHYGVKRAQVDNYLRQVRANIAKDSEYMRKNALERHLAFRAFLKSEAMADGDLRLAFDISRDEAKLLGLYPTIQLRTRNENISIDLNSVDLDKLSDKQVKQLARGQNPKTVLSDQS